MYALVAMGCPSTCLMVLLLWSYRNPVLWLILAVVGFGASARCGDTLDGSYLQGISQNAAAESE